MSTKTVLEVDFELIDHCGVTVILLTYIRNSVSSIECKSGTYKSQSQ